MDLKTVKEIWGKLQGFVKENIAGNLTKIKLSGVPDWGSDNRRGKENPGLRRASLSNGSRRSVPESIEEAPTMTQEILER